MNSLYSRRERMENRRNIRRAFVFSILTVFTVVAFIFFGLPTIAKYASFLADLRKSDQPVEDQDKTPPPPPQISYLPDHTNSENIDINGSTEQGANVFLVMNGTIKELIADKDGHFTQVFTLSDGENVIEAYVKDTSGNQSQSTQKYSIELDKQPPDLEIAKPDDGSTFYGARQRQLTIEGITEASASLSINNRFVVLDGEGGFSYITTLNEGENTFTVKSQDRAGNVTEKQLKINFSP